MLPRYHLSSAPDRPGRIRKPDQPEVLQSAALHGLNAPTRRGLAGAPGRTKHRSPRGLAADDPQSLAEDSVLFSRSQQEIEYHNRAVFARVELTVFRKMRIMTQMYPSCSVMNLCDEEAFFNMNDLTKRTWAEISLPAIRHNYHAIRSTLPAGRHAELSI